MAAERVFIVEDDVDMVEALRLPLEAHGYRVFQAGSAREALGRIGEVNPDLIILDVMMESDTAGFQMPSVVSVFLRMANAHREGRRWPPSGIEQG